VIKAGAVGLTGFRLAVDADHLFDPFYDDALEETYELNDFSPEAINTVLVAFFEALFAASGYERPKNLWNSPPFAGRPADIIRPRIKSALCWMGCAASTALPRYAGARVLPRGLYYSWSKEFLEAGKRRLAGDTARAATSSEVKDLRRQAQELKEVVAEQALELRLLKKA
jgi:hypothetical protein